MCAALTLLVMGHVASVVVMMVVVVVVVVLVAFAVVLPVVPVTTMLKVKAIVVFETMTLRQ